MGRRATQRQRHRLVREAEVYGVVRTSNFGSCPMWHGIGEERTRLIDHAHIISRSCAIDGRIFQ